MRKVNTEQQTSAFSGGNGEGLNIQTDNSQTLYRKENSDPKLAASSPGSQTITSVVIGPKQPGLG